MLETNEMPDLYRKLLKVGVFTPDTSIPDSVRDIIEDDLENEENDLENSEPPFENETIPVGIIPLWHLPYSEKEKVLKEIDTVDPEFGRAGIKPSEIPPVYIPSMVDILHYNKGQLPLSLRYTEFEYVINSDIYPGVVQKGIYRNEKLADLVVSIDKSESRTPGSYFMVVFKQIERGIMHVSQLEDPVSNEIYKQFGMSTATDSEDPECGILFQGDVVPTIVPINNKLPLSEDNSCTKGKASFYYLPKYIPSNLTEYEKANYILTQQRLMEQYLLRANNSTPSLIERMLNKRTHQVIAY